jgi:hypothetical protein
MSSVSFFDVVAPELTEAELRVALYIIRRTFGFKKASGTCVVFGLSKPPKTKATV